MSIVYTVGCESTMNIYERKIRLDRYEKLKKFSLHIMVITDCGRSWQELTKKEDLELLSEEDRLLAEYDLKDEVKKTVLSHGERFALKDKIHTVYYLAKELIYEDDVLITSNLKLHYQENPYRGPSEELTRPIWEVCDRQNGADHYFETDLDVHYRSYTDGILYFFSEFILIYLYK